jgi:uncharacterized protein YdhG (YjbR/CyaY superfamily)
MRKGKAGKRKTAAKTEGGPNAVGEYLAGVPKSTRAVLDKLRATIRSAAPADATEVISYGIPAFKQKRVLVWYAAFSNHCSLFPTASVIEEFRDELKGFATSKGTIQFPIDKPLPVTLIKKIVKARGREAS